jgi:hypothetical protein
MNRVVSYANDIKSLFTEVDRQHMDFMFDLWSYDDVKANAAEILDAVANKRMPPQNPWPDESVALFREWVDGQCQP